MYVVRLNSTQHTQGGARFLIQFSIACYRIDFYVYHSSGIIHRQKIFVAASNQQK